ncbi:hypothetical protein Syun_023077 [Stephania yunnanensis]|uniref:Uncharacterized protein n=1 Tax=Stephania yunnanensis TaxID=152371 RepID=A0AAP0F956_9MAGN
MEAVELISLEYESAFECFLLRQIRELLRRDWDVRVVWVPRAAKVYRMARRHLANSLNHAVNFIPPTKLDILLSQDGSRGDKGMGKLSNFLRLSKFHSLNVATQTHVVHVVQEIATGTIVAQILDLLVEFIRLENIEKGVTPSKRNGGGPLPSPNIRGHHPSTLGELGRAGRSTAFKG